MPNYNAFRTRMEQRYGATGDDPSHKKTSASITADRRIMTSRTRSEISKMVLLEKSDETFILEEEEKRFCIISDIDTFYKRLIWYRPDDGATLGEYITYKDKTYLTTLTKEVEHFPQAEVMHCNFDFPIKGKTDEIVVGLNDMKRPIREYIRTPDYTIPSVVRSTFYSTIDNSQMPLPVGAIYIYVAYHEDIKIPYNYKFDYRGGSYKITSINDSFLLEDENKKLYGYLELRCQREQKEGEKD